MDPATNAPLKDLNQIQLRDLVDGIAEEYRDVLKIRLKNSGVAGVLEEIAIRQTSSAGFFDIDTGAIAVVEHQTGGKVTRQIIILNNGFRSEGSEPRLGPPRELIQQGPFKKSRDGVQTKYIKRDNLRIEYKGTQATRVFGPGDVEIKGMNLEDFKILPNEHHAEMRILQWAERNNYRILSLAPTRGCCPHCALRMKQYFVQQNVNIDDAIPKSRQTRGLWRSYLKQLRAPKPAPVQYTAGHLDVPALRAKFQAQANAFRIPSARLTQISTVLKVAGPAMLAFDAATSSAKAADQWNKGNRDAAAETLAEFGGRAAGAFVGAEACGLAFAGCGSVIPGLGTTVGGLAGVLIGGVVGAYVGEKGAHELCEKIIAWTKGAAPPAPTAPPVASKPHAPQPEVSKLQNEMRTAGYSPAEIDIIQKLFESPQLAGKSPGAALEQVGSNLVPMEATKDGNTWLAQYPAAGEPDRIVTSVSAEPWHSPTPPVLIPTPSSPTPPPTATRPTVPVTAQHHDRPQPIPEPTITETVHAELIKPQAPIELSATPESPLKSERETEPASDLSERVDQLRTRLAGYDTLGAGQTSPVSRDQFDADLNELRAIQDQLMLSGGSAMDVHALQLKLNEVRSRYDQIDSDAHSADDRKAEILRKEQEEERWRADQARLDAKTAERVDGPSQPERPDDRDLRDLEDRERKNLERDRQEEQVREDDRKRREQNQETLDRQAREDRAARWQAEDDRKVEEARQRKEADRQADERERQQQQNVETSVHASKIDADQQRHDEKQQRADERAQQEQDDARDRQARDAREDKWRADDKRKEDERKKEDALHKEEADRKANERQQQHEADARDRIAQGDAERRNQDDNQARADEDARQRAANVQSQTDEADRRADERRRQEEDRQRDDQRRADQANKRSDEVNQRSDPNDRRTDDRRDPDDAQHRANEDRRRDEQRAADEAARANHERQLDQQARDSHPVPKEDARINESPARDDAKSSEILQKEADRQRAEEVARRLAEEILQRQQAEQQRLAEEARQLQQQKEEQRRADEELRRQQAEQRLAEEARQRQLQQQEEQRQAELEWQRQERQRIADEEWRRQQEAEQQRLAEEAWQRQEQQRLADEEWRRQQEEERLRREAEERQRWEDERRRQQEEQERQQREAEQRQRWEEERRQREEEERQRREAEERQRWEDERRRQQEEEERKNVSGKILWPGQDPYP